MLNKAKAAVQSGVGSVSAAIPAELSVDQIGKALHEALALATQRAVSIVSAADGFLKNQAIQIGYPEELKSMLTTIQKLPGVGPQVDDLHVTMNRAAEQSSALALEVFSAVITGLTFDDAKALVAAGGTAAADFFEKKTRAILRSKFIVIVREKMSELGAVKLYTSICAAVDKVPLMKAPKVDVTDHVTDKALDGLFHTLREQEKGIRETPAACNTKLLIDVFHPKK